MSPEVITIIGIVISGSVSFLAAYLVYRVNYRRMGSQNRKDDMDAATTALEIAEKATQRQLSLESEVHELKRMLNAQNYRVTVVFRLGEKPVIEKATIETVS